MVEEFDTDNSNFDTNSALSGISSISTGLGDAISQLGLGIVKNGTKGESDDKKTKTPTKSKLLIFLKFFLKKNLKIAR